MKRLQKPLLYGILTIALLIGVATLVWAAIPAGFYVQYTASDTITLPAGVVFNAPTATITSLLTSAGATALSGVISPPQITANQNDYNPTGLSTASVLRLSTDASRTLTGLMGGTAGRLVLIHNVGIQNLVLASDSVSSTAANRFEFPGDLTLISKAMVLVQYDGTNLRWHTSYPSLTAGPVSASLLAMTVQTGDPSPIGGTTILYAKDAGLHTRDSAGNIEGPLGTGGPGGTGVGLTARLITTTNITRSGEQTFEGISTNSSRVFVAGQTTPTENGIYITSSVAWTRAIDAAAGASFTSGTLVTITDGIAGPTGNKGTCWTYTSSGSYNTSNLTSIKSCLGPTGELQANRSTVAASVPNGTIGSDANGRVPYNRIGSSTSHVALAVGNSINPTTTTSLEIGIEGSTAAVDLTSNPQIVAGNEGQILFLYGTHATRTVQIDNGAGVRLCGNRGSVIVGLNRDDLILRYNTTVAAWVQQGCQREIYGPTDLASAYKICDTVGGNCLNFYGSTIRGTNAGNDIDQITNCPSGKNCIIQVNGVESERITSPAGVHSYSGAAKPRKAVFFPASAISTDGTNCSTPAEVTINGGPKQFAFTCANSTGSIFYLSLSMFNTGWDGGAVRATLHATHGATETINFSGAFAAQCHGDAEVIDSIFGTGVTTTVGITTANRYERQESADITPAGSCLPGDFLWVKYTRTVSEANSNLIKILGVTVSFLASTRHGGQE